MSQDMEHKEMTRANRCDQQNGISATRLMLCILLTCGICFFMQTASMASNLVSGKHLKTSGKTLIVSLNVKSPAPSNLIVEQFLAPGNNISHTSPPAKKINARSGKIKWLFRKISPGKLTITTVLKSPLRGTVSCVVRYRDPKSGQYVEQRIN